MLVASLLAEEVGFEPTGLAPQQISSLRRYDHFGTPPHNSINFLDFRQLTFDTEDTSELRVASPSTSTPRPILVYKIAYSFCSHITAARYLNISCDLNEI